VLDYISGDEAIWEREAVRRLAHDGQLAGYRHSGFWSCMDTLKEKNYLEELWTTGRAPWRIWEDHPADPEAEPRRWEVEPG
jgi:glucose-1-phosphate cytidylyltransferase